MEILGKILGSVARVKIMRLFLLNRSKSFEVKDIASRTRVTANTVRKELRVLHSVNFVKKSNSSLWSFNNSFKYTSEFEGLLVSSNSLSRPIILDGFKKNGQLKLLVLSGVFIQNQDSRVDLLVVGDKMKKNKIEEVVRKLEAEIGTELVYAVFETKEFIYRLNMYDKLIRDILDFPHEILLQGKEFSPAVLYSKQD